MSSQLKDALSACLAICTSLGEPGQAVWELGDLYVSRKKKPLTQLERLEYLKMAISWLKEKAKNAEQWRELPVDIRTFIDSPKYLNKIGTTWPVVMNNLLELNSGKYVEAVLTGGIGVAKSHIACYTQAYQTYLLSCMEELHETFDLDSSSEIMIVFQSINKNVATDVDYRRLRDIVANSPYFTNKFPFQQDRESDMRFPRNIVVKPVSGHDQAAIGQNVIGGILDEINFMAVVENSKQSKDGGTYDQALSNYNSIARRRESRFMKKGSLPGMLCLVSSRNYPGQFTDIKEQEAKTNPRIFVYDKRRWDVKPDDFCFYDGVRTDELKKIHGENYPFWFQVFIGDATRKPRIMQPDERVADVDRHLVMDIPIEYKLQFEGDLLNNLRDIAGVATQALHPFMMNTEAIVACFGKANHVASTEVADFRDTRVQYYPRRVIQPEHPRFAHIDIGISRDSAGVAIGHVFGFKKMLRGDYSELLPVIYIDVLMEVQPPRGGEIEIDHLRRLIYSFNRLGAAKVKWVSFDQFQSKDSEQILRQHGFVTGQQSMDVDTLAYDTLRQAVYDGRLLLPTHAKAQKELVQLEYNAKDMKVDHPPKGSKDVADALAAVVLGLTMRRECWLKHGVSSYQIPRTLTEKSKPVVPTAPLDVLKAGREAAWENSKDERWTDRLR